MSRDIFFDTDIFMGFIYYDGHWRDKAETVLSAVVPKYTSSTVLDEYQEKNGFNQRVRRCGPIEFRYRLERSITSDPKTSLIDMAGRSRAWSPLSSMIRRPEIMGTSRAIRRSSFV